jgi:predicted AlkP superfamily phosphohydrolase/phosphomutase
MTATLPASVADRASRADTTHKSVILLEFNELSPVLIRRFMDAGELPNFHRLYRESHAYTTDAEEAAPNLEPWIQWVTVHSGLSFEEHGIFHLGDGHQLDRKCIWDILSDHGLRVWVCGSMNARYDQPINGCVLPDPWATGVDPYPEELGTWSTFAQRNVQEHTNDRVPLTKADYVKFVAFMASHGLSLSTAAAIVKQLLRERVARTERWRRATILDKLQWDVFRWYYRKYKPHFSTFFLNSTAYYQHRYWRNMDPEPFKVKPTAEEQAHYASAVLYGYKEMDRIVGAVLALAERDTTVVLASALSQQPCLLYEDIGGKTFYRPRDFAELLRFAGVDAPHKVAPVMSEQFHLHFDTEAAAAAAAGRLGALVTAGRPLVTVEQRGSSVFAGCRIFEQLPRDAVVTAGESARSAPFFDLLYQAEGIKSGMHHPDGILWLRHPGRDHKVVPERVPLRSVAPTILKLFGVPRPAFMTGEAVV